MCLKKTFKSGMIFQTKWIEQFIKYVLVGGINFFLSMILFFLLLKIFLFKYLIAFTFTWLFGILLTYVINFLWVFKPDDKLKFRKSLPKYFVVYITSYLINIGLLKILVQSCGFDPFWLQFFILPIVVLINFFGFKFWALKEESGL